jgi:hypothetical protein
VFRFLVAVFLVSVFCDAKPVFAGCARERHPVDEIDVSAITGFASGRLVLMPRCVWSYSDGMFKVTFAVPRKPCNGSSCQLPLPNRSNDFRSIADTASHYSNGSVAQGTGSFKIIEPEDSERIVFSRPNYSSIDSSPLERPPITV